MLFNILSLIGIGTIISTIVFLVNYFIRLREIKDLIVNLNRKYNNNDLMQIIKTEFDNDKYNKLLFSYYLFCIYSIIGDSYSNLSLQENKYNSLEKSIDYYNLAISSVFPIMRKRIFFTKKKKRLIALYYFKLVVSLNHWYEVKHEESLLDEAISLACKAVTISIDINDNNLLLQSLINRGISYCICQVNPIHLFN